MAPLLKYTVLRVTLFVAALALLSVLRAGLPVAVIGAAVISMMLSYILLRGPRDELAQLISSRSQHRIDAVQERLTARAAEDTAIEDAADERARQTPERPADPKP